MTQVELVVDVLKKNEERLSDGYHFYQDDVDEALREIAEEILEDLHFWSDVTTHVRKRDSGRPV